ncbi:MAG: LemA family protein [Patescibacteria group bacterium]
MEPNQAISTGTAFWKKPLVIVIGVVLLVGLWFMGSYNSFVSTNESVDAAWAQVETQYQRRFDLIPNLVSSVQGAMKQETAVFLGIANARQGYAGARTVDQKVAASVQMESALSRLLVVMENYPQLRSVETVLKLQDELSGTENRISVERSRYNDIVRKYNVKVKSFPGNLFASLFGFEPRVMFESVEEAAKAPVVNF